MDLTTHWVGYSALVLFTLAYLLVIAEEFTHLRKSKPVLLAAGLIWALVAFKYTGAEDPSVVEKAVRHFLVEFSELFLFLLTAMTYVNAMSERQVFEKLRSWLVNQGYSYRHLFWITGTLSFFLS
ncbi:MAG: sodium:proton antiporter, partial [Deltaproteobacteria bacterium]|nr:sodium:proton antiporter [Deltaproteobacteria bacterium]